MIKVNSDSMHRRYEAPKEFFELLSGRTSKFVVIENYLSTTEYRDKMDFKKMPLVCTKSTVTEVIIESISYDPFIQEFTINKKYKTRRFTCQ